MASSFLRRRTGLPVTELARRALLSAERYVVSAKEASQGLNGWKTEDVVWCLDQADIYFRHARTFMSQHIPQQQCHDHS